MIFSTVFGPHEPALTVGSFAMTATWRPGDRAHARHDAVGAEPVLLPVREQRLLGERVGVEQARDPLAHGQLALLRGLLVVARRPAGAGVLERLPQVRHRGHTRRSARSATRDCGAGGVAAFARGCRRGSREGHHRAGEIRPGGGGDSPRWPSRVAQRRRGAARPDRGRELERPDPARPDLQAPLPAARPVRLPRLGQQGDPWHGDRRNRGRPPPAPARRPVRRLPARVSSQDEARPARELEVPRRRVGG